MDVLGVLVQVLAVLERLLIKLYVSTATLFGVGLLNDVCKIIIIDLCFAFPSASTTGNWQITRAFYLVNIKPAVLRTYVNRCEHLSFSNLAASSLLAEKYATGFSVYQAGSFTWHFEIPLLCT